MAKPRVRKNRDGSYSATARVRRKGYPEAYETFRATTRKEAVNEAIAWASRIEQQMYHKDKKDPRAGRVRLAAYFQAYFSHLELTRRKAASTIQGEKWSANQLLRILGADIFLSDITTTRMADFRDTRIGEGVGASKIRSELALISSLFRYAVQEKGLPLENPVGREKLWRPKAPKGKKDVLTRKQIIALVDECRKSKARNGKTAAYVMVMLQTGMRPGEAAQLRVNMIDVKKRSIKLVLTKNGEERLIQLTDNAFRELARCVIGKKPRDYVFYDAPSGEDSATLPPNYQKKPAALFRGPFDNAKKAIGLDWITRHTMRHTAATEMIRNGTDVRIVAEVFGWKVLQMAMTYTHPDEEMTRKAMAPLNDLGVK